MCGLVNGKLYIKKRTLPEWLTLYIFLMPFFLSFFMDFLMVPSLIKYTIDIAWCSVMVVILFRKKITMNQDTTRFAIFTLVFLLYVGILYLFHYQSIFYFLWGFRNNFRFYAAFLGFSLFLTPKTVQTCFKALDGLYWINIAITLYQFFVMGLKQDYLGGVFGVQRGCNGYSMIFILIVVLKSLLKYMNKEGNTVYCLFICMISLVIAALAELKFYFVLFVFVVLFCTIITKFSWRKFWMLFFLALAVTIGSFVLTLVFGEDERLTFERIYELFTATNYATAEDLGRFTAIPIISKQILTTAPLKLFGLGLGNCDTSSFAICNTPFFVSHEGMHYHWFSSSFLFLEVGCIGLLFHMFFYILCFIKAYKNYRNSTGNQLFCQLSMTMALVCIIMVFYNSSLRTETGYIAYFTLALFMIQDSSVAKKNNEIIN